MFITGRAKDVIIRGAHNIEPGLIEEALMRHPEVQFAAAVGEPDEYAGEIPVAFVVLKPGATIDAAGLIEFAREFIPERPAHPKRIDLLPALPLTAIGKVYKPGLRLRAIERVIIDRLKQAGLGQEVQVAGQDSARGLSLALRATAGASAEVQTKVRAIMARFAIPWTWSP